MTKFKFSSDELYPVFYPGNGKYFEFELVLTQEEYNEFVEIHKKWSDWQDKLKKLSELQDSQ